MKNVIKYGDKLELNHEHDYITVEVIDIDVCEKGKGDIYVFTLGGSAGFDSYAYKNQIKKVNGRRV